MKSSKPFILPLILSLILTLGCSGGGGGNAPSSSTTTAPTPVTTPPVSLSAKNVMRVTVNGALCKAGSYLNKPCVSVTICTPGTSTCQTINDILLDTGNSGLRLFKQIITVPLNPVTDSAGDLIAQCVSYGDGSTHWGPIQEADIILGEETAVRTPIQVIDAAFATAPATCATADSTPAESGFNGILGVGYFVQDCGPTCASMVKNGMYYACHGLTCNKSSVPLVKQVQNPVALLPEDNNGIIVQMPDVPASGSTSVDGYLVLGIGTKTNNIPTTAETYPTDSSGYFATLFDGHLYSSFADTGSNGLFFPPPAGNILPDCANPLSAWFCPTALTNLSATNTGASGSPVGSVSFQIDNFISLISSGNEVYANIGGQNAGDFDWGLPFFLGRNVYIGIEGKSSSLGTGPYISY